MYFSFLKKLHDDNNDEGTVQLLEFREEEEKDSSFFFTTPSHNIGYITYTKCYKTLLRDEYLIYYRKIVVAALLLHPNSFFCGKNGKFTLILRYLLFFDFLFFFYQKNAAEIEKCILCCVCT